MIDIFLLDGLLIVSGENGKSFFRYVGGGGSGGSVWFYCNIIIGNVIRNVICNVILL